ncbi:bestrophin family ion channel [Fluviicola taffensis]|uniref:bestrophin family protein n=1 Tax=Fluviicola taffensis TaxID=191579 RepID=UPI003137D5D0
MITYNPKSWLTLIFHLTKSDTLSILWKELVFIFIFTMGVALAEDFFFPKAVVLEKLFSIYSILGFVISLLLAFRTNTAYDRWWEGRKKWGELVNDSRNLAVKLTAMDLSLEDNHYFGRHIGNFALCIKEHLREGTNYSLLDLTEEERKFLEALDHVPSGIVELMYRRLHQLKKAGVISEEDLLRLDKNLNGFIDCVGACERIKNTPIPYSYSMFFKKFIFSYVITLPFAFVVNFGYYSAIIATFIFYVFVSIEILAEEIEDPFGQDDNDLPTDEMAGRIQGIVKTILDKP